MPAESILLLHISDLHLARRFRPFRNSKCRVACLEEIARIAFKNRNNINSIIVSGDIADTDLNDDLFFAKDFLFSQDALFPRYPWITINNVPTLKATGKQIIFMPGNHDKFHFGTGIPDSKKFDNTFKSLSNSYTDTVNSFYIPDKNNPKLAIICADFSLKSWRHTIPGYYFGHGRVYNDRLNKVLDSTIKIRKSYDIPIIWALHFAPDKLSNKSNPASFKLKLLRSKELIKNAEKLGIEHIICGHIHDYTYYNAGMKSNVWVCSSGTSACFSSNHPPSLNLIDIEIHLGSIKQFNILPLYWDGNTFK